MALAAFIPAALWAADKILGGGGGKNKSQNDFSLVDTGVYPFGPFERGQLGDAYLQNLSQLQTGYENDPTGMKMAEFFRSRAGHASAGHASASLIDLNDIAFQPEPTAGLREDVYGRLHSGALAQAEDAKAQLRKALAASGVSANSPYGMYLASKIDRTAGAAATQGLTSFYDDFVTQALGRRAGAETVNANLGTNVSIANAGYNTQASIANAQMGQQAFQFGAGYGQQNLEILLRALQWGMSPNDHQSVVGQGGSTSYEPGWGDAAGEVAGSIRDGVGKGSRSGIDPGIAADAYTALAWM